MWRGKARSAEICRPNGVTRAFQVRRYKIEPVEGNFCCNLFSKERCRFEGFDELEPDRQEVPVVVERLLLA